MNNNHSWVEKYRPSKLEEVSSQKIIIDALKNVLITKKIPHLLFYGPSGSGKTSTILALAKELFNQDISMNRIIELNASDERGINVIRDKIKKYSKQLMNTNNNLPPWKFIILDEADTMTTDSQFALRRIMEQYSKITRFCIICNYHTKIIDPIISRCALFHFKPINEEHILMKLQFICNKENINYNNELLKKIIDLSRGDLRKAINFLQKCYNIYNNSFNMELLKEISGIISDNTFNELINNIIKKDTINVDKIINNIHIEGYSLVNQILLFHNFIINSNFTDDIKSKIIILLCDIDHNLIKGCNEYIQFLRLVYYIMSII
jgi:replication factor C subunit 2/4